MLSKDNILKQAKENGKILTKDLVRVSGVSRQYASLLVGELVADHKLIKLGSTRGAFYVLPSYAEQHAEIFPIQYTRSFKNIALEEHKVLDEIEKAFPRLTRLPENIRSIFTFAFSEMFNNAIEHSRSKTISIEVALKNGILSFIVSDTGVGAFRNIMKKKKLQSELEAIQDLLKGKTTTMPTSHSGEGIFFTSKVGSLFTIESFGYQLMVNNTLPDIFIEEREKIKKGTKVLFAVPIKSTLHLSDVFKKYTNMTDMSDHGFDKTEVSVKLYMLEGIHISRSQARRVLSGLEKFKVIVFDFAKVPVVGQAFADEIYRVFHHKYPHITLEEVHTNEGVQFMIERAKHEAKREEEHL